MKDFLSDALSWAHETLVRKGLLKYENGNFYPTSLGLEIGNNLKKRGLQSTPLETIIAILSENRTLKADKLFAYKNKPSWIFHQKTIESIFSQKCYHYAKLCWFDADFPSIYNMVEIIQDEDEPFGWKVLTH